MSEATPTPEQVVTGLAQLLDGPDGSDVRERLLRIASLTDNSGYARLLGHLDAGAEERAQLAADLLDRIAPEYTARLREAA